MMAPLLRPEKIWLLVLRQHWNSYVMKQTGWETVRVTAMVRVFVIRELTDGAAGHGGEDPQGGWGPTVTNQGIGLSFLILPSDIPLQLPSSSSLTLTSGQAIVAVWESQASRKLHWNFVLGGIWCTAMASLYLDSPWSALSAAAEAPRPQTELHSHFAPLLTG